MSRKTVFRIRARRPKVAVVMTEADDFARRFVELAKERGELSPHCNRRVITGLIDRYGLTELRHRAAQFLAGPGPYDAHRLAQYIEEIFRDQAL